nr:MAG TPA: hypothetical protein [Caudoviricetes sp.]
MKNSGTTFYPPLDKHFCGYLGTMVLYSDIV